MGTVRDDYVRLLRAMHGKEFERECCTQIGRRVLDFQPVPDRDRGDGGLDGLSHNATVAYCCYGPEPTAGNKGALNQAIVTKFRADLYKLFEVSRETQRGPLVHSHNQGLDEVLEAKGEVIIIRLIVNAFDSKSLIKRLRAARAEAASASQCRYVARDSQVVVWGPEQLADDCPPDDLALLRARNSTFMRALDDYGGDPDDLSPEQRVELSEKMDALRENVPKRSNAIDDVEKTFLSEWADAIAFEQRVLDDSSPIFRAYAGAQRDAISEGQMLQLSIASGEVDAMRTAMQEMRNRTREIFCQALEDRIGREEALKVANGHFARMAGECLFDWRRE